MPKVSEAHRAERRRQILDGARRAFATHGYEGATVAELEAAIGLSRGAIFSYYPSKWELFYALASADQERVGRLWLEQGFEAVVRATGAESPDWVGVYFEIMRMLRTDGTLRERWSQRNPELHEQVTEHLVQCQRDGLYRDDLTIEEIGQFLGIVLDGLTVHLGAGFPVDVDGTIELVRAALSPK
jgi:AcrR family transcriptional regulator